MFTKKEFVMAVVVSLFTGYVVGHDMARGKCIEAIIKAGAECNRKEKEKEAE